MSQNILVKSVGMLCLPILPISAENSLRLAAERFREQGLPVLPVYENGQIAGIIDQEDLVQALSMGLEPASAVSSIPYSRAPMLYATATGSEALRMFAERKHRGILVVDQDMNLVGLLTPAMLYPRTLVQNRPRMVGGMATPFGVYLTTGAQRGGVSNWALMATGITLFLLHAFGSIIGELAGSWMARMQFATPQVVGTSAGAIATLAFFVGIRSIPLSGYHAAEHMVVHAIERGEELEPEVVKRMPRVHPRCGTNLAAAAIIFISIATGEWTKDSEFRILVAILVTLMTWRIIGSWLQQNVTTRPPNKKQLMSAIKAGRELLNEFERSPIIAPGPGARILSSGMLQIMAGSFLCALILDGFSKLTGLVPFLRVY